MPEQANPTVSAASPPPLQYVPSRMSVWRIAAAVFVTTFSARCYGSVLAICVFVAFFAVLGPRIGNVFSRITNGLGAP